MDSFASLEKNITLMNVMGGQSCTVGVNAEKKQLDATEWFIALIICSTCFGRLYAQSSGVRRSEARTPDRRPQTTKALHTISGNRTSVVSKLLMMGV